MSERTEILHENLELYFDEKPLSGNVLIVGDDLTDLPGDVAIDYWLTRFHTDHPASELPSTEKKLYETILIRLPKSHEYFDFVLRVTTSMLSLQGNIYVYGLNDEGIKGSQKKLTEFYQLIDPVFIKNHGRIVSAQSPVPATKNVPSHTENVESFSQVHSIKYGEKKYELTYYPGMFGSGVLDIGTELLLDTALPTIKDGLDVLDYASGSGIIAQVLKTSVKNTTVDLLDNDTLSLSASKLNVPNAREFILGDSLSHCDEESQYDIIISNPPIHTEKREQFDTLYDLIKRAPRHLRPGGRLIIVVQARIPLEEILEKSFRNYTILAETTRFKVWCATAI